VTTKDVTTFADKYLVTSSSLVIVGKGSAFVETLKKSFSETRVIPQSNLDLNRADLEKHK
jgi:phospholipid N-methyltransferase